MIGVKITISPKLPLYLILPIVLLICERIISSSSGRSPDSRFRNRALLLIVFLSAQENILRIEGLNLH